MLAGWEVSEDFVVPQARLGDWQTGTDLVGRRHLEAGPVGQRMSRAGSSHLRAGPVGGLWLASTGE